MGKLVNLIGNRYGRLVILERDQSKPLASGGRRVYWICECECGSVISRTGHDLKDGSIKSCGCLNREQAASVKYSHGKHNSPTYYSWQAMKSRCENPRNWKYNQYGGRGIKVCDRWRNSFINFMQDMGERPSGYTLDRIDPNGNYEHNNCRWATPKQQANNKRNSYP